MKNYNYSVLRRDVEKTEEMERKLEDYMFERKIERPNELDYDVDGWSGL